MKIFQGRKLSRTGEERLLDCGIPSARGGFLGWGGWGGGCWVGGGRGGGGGFWVGGGGGWCVLLFWVGFGGFGGGWWGGHKGAASGSQQLTENKAEIISKWLHRINKNLAHYRSWSGT